MNEFESYVRIAFCNFGIFLCIFHTSIYFWKLPFVSDMYHSYFRTSLFCSCRKPYWNWAYTFLNCTWWMTKPGHIFKIFPLLGLRTLHFGSWISLLFKICQLFPTFPAYPTRIWMTFAFKEGITKWVVGTTFLWYSYPLYSYFSREYSYFSRE